MFLTKISAMKTYDVIIIGAGAAGLTAARIATARGRRTAVLDMGDAPARKVAASGGGRCNFTNAAAARDRYFGENPDFVRGAISRVSPNDILDWMTEHNLQYTQKAPGQYFCATGAKSVVDALVSDAGAADILLNTTACGVKKSGDEFTVETAHGNLTAQSVIIASGGTSFGAIGVSDIGFKIAKSFGHTIVPVRPALCGIESKIFPTEFAGISIPVEIRIGKNSILDDMLFTHFGIGGPAVYRATVRDTNNDWVINLLPSTDVAEWLRGARKTDGKRKLTSLLSQKLPARIAKWAADNIDKNIADISDSTIGAISSKLTGIVVPVKAIKYHGLQSAEIIRGGVSTRDISSKTMESKLCRNLFFAGEVLDIAGDLGGFNLHWAWASGFVAGQNA